MSRRTFHRVLVSSDESDSWSADVMTEDLNNKLVMTICSKRALVVVVYLLVSRRRARIETLFIPGRLFIL